MAFFFIFFSDLAGEFPPLPMFMTPGTFLPSDFEGEMGLGGSGKFHIVALLAKSVRNIRDEGALYLLFGQHKMFNKLSQSPDFRLDHSRDPFS